MILVTVEKAGFNKSPWDSYVKKFSTEEAFLDWWTGVPEKSYTKRVAVVHVFRATEDGSLIAPWAPPAETV
jgi:hypothetical protein